MTKDTKLPPYLPFPRFLLEADLALATKLVYMVLLDRARLSQANGWADSSSQIYIVFPIVEIANTIDRSPIIDDFGMERGTEYGLEQVYNVIDSRYRSKKPLIVTTNIPLHDLQHPQDTAHARIYDRLLEMCSPIRFSGENFRKATAQDKLARLKNLMD